MSVDSPKAPRLRVGTLADQEMLTGPLARRRELLERARTRGLDHVFVADHISFHTGFGMDGLIQAATIAALEPELAIHIGVYLLALRGLLGGHPVSHDGPFFSFEQALIRPAPDPAVPIVIGGRSDLAIRRAALLGDGWLGVWCSPARFARVVEQIAEMSVDRTVPVPDSWDHGLQVWVGLDSNPERGRSRLASRMEGMYRTPYERFERYSPYGRANEIAEFLAPYIEAGCRHLNIMPVAESTEAGLEGVAEIRERLVALTR